MIAERLGLLKEYTGGKSVEEWIKFGFEHSNMPRIHQLRGMERKGLLCRSHRPGLGKEKPGYREFYDDPEKYPLKTPSGKLEFYSETLAKHFPDDKERPPYPKWIPYGESHQESLLCERAKKYPAAGSLQPSQMGSPCQPSGCHLVPGNPDLQGQRSGRLSVSSGLDSPAGCR